MSLKTLFGKSESQTAAAKPTPAAPENQRASFLITGSSSVNNEYSWQGFWMTGVLTGLGIEPCAILYEGRAHSKKWPEIGQTLPVMIDRAGPTVTKILWDEVPDPKVTGMERAKKIVISMNPER